MKYYIIICGNKKDILNIYNYCFSSKKKAQKHADALNKKIQSVDKTALAYIKDLEVL